MRKLKFRFWKDKTLQGVLELEKNGIIDMEWEWDSVDQFTGLFDKFGKEIYEGDIVRWLSSDGNNYMTHVLFRNGSFVTGGIYLSAVSDFELQGISWPFDKDNRMSERICEILGNIYSNPELLEPPLGNNAEPIRKISEDDWRKDDR